MKKIRITIILSAILLFYFLHGISYANTFIYALKQNGVEIGKWGIETTKDGDAIRCKSIGNFSGDVGGLDLLRNLKGEKKVTIGLSQEPKMMVQMTRNDKRWEIATEGNDILVSRYHNNQLIDELGINPILPVYDLTSLLFSFRYIHPQSSFDFYIIEEVHEKRLHVSRRNNRSWDLKYRNSPLVRINLRQDGIPEELNFSHSNFYNLRGYRLSLLCERSSPLEARRVISPAEVLRTWASEHHIGQENLTNRQGRFQKISNEYQVDYTDCLSINKDITQDIKRKIIANMRKKEAIGDTFRDEYIDIRYDPGKQSFYPAFNRTISKTYNLNDIESDLQEKGINCTHIFLSEDRKGISYQYNDCKKKNKVLRQINLLESFKDTFPEKEEPEWFEVAETGDKVLIISGCKKGFFSKKVIGLIKFKMEKQMEKFLPEEHGISLEKLSFDTADLTSDRFRIVNEIEECEEQEKEYVIFRDNFLEEYGIKGEFLRYSPRESNASIIVTCSLERLFDLTKRDVIKQVKRTLLPQDIREPNIVTNGNIYYLNGTGSVSLSQNSILDLFNIPRSAQINMDNENLICVYQDFDCPTQ